MCDFINPEKTVVDINSSECLGRALWRRLEKKKSLRDVGVDFGGE